MHDRRVPHLSQQLRQPLAAPLWFWFVSSSLGLVCVYYNRFERCLCRRVRMRAGVSSLAMDERSEAGTVLCARVRISLGPVVQNGFGIGYIIKVCVYVCVFVCLFVCVFVCLPFSLC